MKKFLIIIGIVAATVGILWLQIAVFAGPKNPAAGEDGAGNAKTPSLITAGETMFDFGNISMGKGNVSHLFKIKNTSAAPVTIKKLYSSCMCTTATLIRKDKTVGPFGMPGHVDIPAIQEIMQPGEEAEVLTVFDPAAHGPAGVGAINRSVLIENDASGPLQLDFKAFVTP